MSATSFIVQGDPQQTIAVTCSLLSSHRFTVVPTDAWSGTAELGSKVKGALLGAASLYVSLGYRLTAGPEAEQSRLTLAQGSTGWMGGAIGASRTKKLLGRLSTELTEQLAAAGLLVAVEPAG